MKWANGTSDQPQGPRITNPQTEPTPVEIRVGSYSEVDTARQCPHKHKLGYRERWISPREAPALRRGTRWHTIMETWYKALAEAGPRRTLASPAVRAAKTEIGEFIAGIDEEDERELLRYMWDEYLKYYGLDREWLVESVEDNWVTPLLDEHGNETKFALKFKIDILVTEIATGRRIVVDHKTARQMPSDKEFAIDDQFGLYIWGVRQHGIHVDYGLHSVSRTFIPKFDDRPENEAGQKLNKDGSVSKSQPAAQLPEDRMRRTKMHRTQKELNQIAVDAYLTLKAMWDMDVQYRSPNPDTCRWRCDYLEACLAGRKGIDEVRLLRSSGFVQDFTRH